jgi:hypothetical protein
MMEVQNNANYMPSWQTEVINSTASYRTPQSNIFALIT